MGASYVPEQQPVSIRTISFAWLANNVVKVIVNGLSRDYLLNGENMTGKTVTRSDQRICIKSSSEKMKWIFPLSSLVSINGLAWTGTNIQNAIDSIMSNSFAGTGGTPAKFDQTIAFTAPAGDVHTAPPKTLNGVASSGLAVSYASSDNTVFTIAGNVVTPVGAGTANITATQAGDANYNAAAPVVRPYTLT